jgi:hypothetical protein
MASDAVYFKNIKDLVFNKNTVTNASNGMYLSNCKDYVVSNNSVIQTSSLTGTGMYIYNSLAGAHQVYRNSFGNLGAGIIAVGNNSGFSNDSTGLKMNCNDFTPSPNTYDIAMMKAPTSILAFPYLNLNVFPTVKVNQGKAISPYNLATDAVRNLYAAVSACSTCENQWYIEGSSLKTINHPATSNSNAKPLPQPDKSDLNVNVIATSLSFNYAVNCPTLMPSSGGSGSTTPSASQRMDNMNKYLSDLLTGSGPDVFEIQATVAAQLNYFLNDTLPESKDSVIAIFESNRGGLPDSDIMTVYAYMNKGDLTGAQNRIDSLAPARADWAALLNKLVYYQANPYYLYNLKTDSTNIAFFENYAAYDTLNGAAAAQSILEIFNRETFTKPRPFPSDGSAARLRQPQTQAAANNIQQVAGLLVYPNPASDAIYVVHPDKNGPGLQLVVTDAVGRRFYEATLSAGETLEIPLRGMPNGVYLLSAYDHKTPVYKGKIICIK